MKLELLSETTYEVLAEHEAEPTHTDLCERCEECLHCCGSQPCAAAIREEDPPFSHRWITYVGDPNRFDRDGVEIP